MKANRILITILILLICSESLIAAQKVPSRDLDQAIEEVIQQREYQWRMPREVVEEEEQGWLFNFLESVRKFLNRIWDPIADLWNKFTKWLGKKLSPSGSSGTGREWTAGELNLLIFILIAALILVLLFFVWRHRRSKRQAEAILAEPILPIPDVADENVVADQLPEEGWQKIAQEFFARGELRLALRAMFMATLAHLAQAQLISVARFKSNWEYQKELQRRAYGRQPMQDAFRENVSTVDRVWYGTHPVTEDVWSRFVNNAETVKRAAA